ncbi:MAG: hypothetical protein K9J30_09960 [Bacteroidales bacterium]|nr:hypothetical protein [Bacteroidales bacterium]
MKNTLFREFRVSSFDINSKGKARLTAIANFLQETAYQHADALGLGYRHLAADGHAWVLSRLKIQVLKYPDWDDTITVETWPRGIEKLFALRDFRLFLGDQEPVVKASTCWLMVNYNSLRPVRLDTNFISIKTRTDRALEEPASRIVLPDEMQQCNAHIVRYSDLDVVGHVNNVKFIEWCIDTLDLERLLGNGIALFEINYTNEARAGDEIEILCSDQKQNNVFIAGRHREDGRECFRSGITYFK